MKMNVLNKVNAWTAALAIALVLVVPGYAYAISNNTNKPGDIPPIAQDVNDRIDALESLIRRLHGDNAAVIPVSDSGSTLDGEVVGAKFTLAVCLPGWDDNASPHAICDSDYTDLVLVSQVFGANDDDAIVTFTAETSPHFSAIIALLTNGENNDMGISVEYTLNDGSWAGSATHGLTDRHAFFNLPQVSSGVGFVDLEGFEIGSISLSVDILGFYYSDNSDTSHPQLETRWFFELAH
jgi:hypothetical protein